MTDHLLRDLAPITDQAWKLIDAEARERLTPNLAGRRLVDWSGPHGWTYSATDLGRVQPIETTLGNGTGEEIAQRLVLPVSEFRVPFTVSRAELANASRGAKNLDLDDLGRAAWRAAECENATILHGRKSAGIIGISEAASGPAQALGTEPARYPHAVAVAVDRLRQAGVDGPYVLAIDPEGFTRIAESTEPGRSLLGHLQQILDGEVIRAPGITGGVVLSRRGGDFALDVAQDFAIGYSHHDADTIHLYLEEAFTFHVVEPDAAVALTG
jgi:uncharacterized linocin/CFP29 family protein